MISESALIEQLKKNIPLALQGKIGIGDDAGVLTPPAGESLVWTTDAMVEGIDFLGDDFPKNRRRPGCLTPQQAGRKALAINLSDLAAMGAKPLGFVISLGIPKNMSARWIHEFYDGLIPLAKKYRVACLGGDLTRASEFFVSIALAGSARESELVQRKRARPGDWIAVTGALGGSILKYHAAFVPRLTESRFLVENFKPTAMIDISDGLLQDLGHILKCSGVGAVLEMGEVPISPDAVQLAGRDPMKALERACTDGEDFELLWTVPARFKPKLEKAWNKKFPRVPLNWIGKIEKQSGIRWTMKGRPVPAPKFKKSGYQHF